MLRTRAVNFFFKSNTLTRKVWGGAVGGGVVVMFDAGCAINISFDDITCLITMTPKFAKNFHISHIMADRGLECGI